MEYAKLFVLLMDVHVKVIQIVQAICVSMEFVLAIQVDVIVKVILLVKVEYVLITNAHAIHRDVLA